MPAEARRYYDERKRTRQRLDLRGKELHGIGRHGDATSGILEIEEGLLKWWVDWQDQPDEIIVDSVVAFEQALTGERAEARGPIWGSDVSRYRTKYAIHPGGEHYIPVFENI